MTSVQTPNKACHNCRRQRLRCDRSYPHCNKCITAGRECLGYGQLFRWTGAVASRGRLAGQTSSAAVSNVPAPAAAASAAPRFRPAEDQQKQGGGSGSSSPSLVQDFSASSSQTSTPSTSEDGGRQMVPWAQGRQSWAESHQSYQPQPQAPRVLIDPVFQDMSQTYRYYLSYFVNRMCRDMVSYDLPEHNPFRNLVPLTRTHPLLQHVVVAASAGHMSNLTRPSLPPAFGSSLGAPLSPYASSWEVSRGALRDSLIAKQKALQLMKMALQNIDAMGGDIVFAAATFLLNTELLESGKRSWKAHLEGAGKIMTLLQPVDGSKPILRDYLLSDCFTYFILGAALQPGKSAQRSNFEASQIRFILQRASANSYISCPPDIMEILYEASQLANANAHVDVEESGEKVTMDAMVLLRRAQDVDVHSWADSIHNLPHLRGIPIQSRIHTASAHVIAACLYLCQVVPTIASHLEAGAIKKMTQDMVHHLDCVTDEDPNFKATTWPTFIAGAGAAAIDPKIRAWSMDRFRRVVVQTPWGCLYTAMEALQVIWKLQDEGQRQKSWVQLLKDSGEEFLIV